MANVHGWIVEKNVSGEGWEADFVVSSSECRLAIMLYRTTRNLPEKIAAMKSEGVKPCWLGNSYKELLSNELYPCFEVDVKNEKVFVALSEYKKIPLEELVLGFLTNKLEVANSIRVNKLKIRFVPYECYFCKKQHFVYYVIGVVYDGIPSLASYEGIYNSGIGIDGGSFNPVVIDSVKKYLKEHPEYNYKMGEIKKRAKDYYLIFALYFIHGIEAKQLKTELSRIAPVYANDYKSFTASDFEALIDRMGDFIFRNESK